MFDMSLGPTFLMFITIPSTLTYIGINLFNLPHLNY